MVFNLMGGSSVNIVISAVDNFSKVIKKARLGLEGLRKNIIPIAGLGITIAGGLFLAVKNASRLEEEISKFNVVFKGSEEVAKKFLQTLQDNYLLSELAARKALSGFQDFLVPMGLARSESALLSGELVKLAADISSFQDKPFDVVMRKFQSALAGETEAVRDLGINVSAVAVQQEAYNLGLAKTGTKLTEVQKIQARSSLLFKNSADAIGDVARTSDGYANTVRQLGADLENLSTVVGDKVKDEFLKPLIELAIKVVDAFSQLPQPIQDIITYTLVLIPIISALALVVLALTSAASPWILAVLAIAALIAGLIILWQKWNDISLKTKALLFALFPPIFLLIFMLKNIGKVAKIFAAIWKVVVTFVKEVWEKLINFLQERLGGYIDYWQDVWIEAGKTIKKVWTFIVSFIGNSVKKVLGFLASLADKLAGFAEKLGFEGTARALRNVTTQLKSGLPTSVIKGEEQKLEDLVRGGDGKKFSSLADVVKSAREGKVFVRGLSNEAEGFKFKGEEPTAGINFNIETVNATTPENFIEGIQDLMNNKISTG